MVAAIGALFLGGFPVAFFQGLGDFGIVIGFFVSLAFTVVLWRMFLNFQVNG
jgi:hypothetical protein